MIRKFMAFTLIGVIGTGAHYSILYGLVEYKQVSPVWASGWGALAGLIINYLLNYSLTFKSQQSHTVTFPKFTAIAMLGLCFNIILMALLTRYLFYFYAQIITSGVILIWNFFANRFWTFHDISSANSDPSKTETAQHPLISGFGITILILVIRVLTLGFYPLYDPSESRYAEMGRKMLETGNWVTPLIDYGVPFWGKPPLTIWLTSFSLWLGGINEFSARLPSLLLSMGTVSIIYLLGKVQRGKDIAVDTVIILASSVLFFVMSGTVAMDLCLNFGITLTLASFWLTLKKTNFYWSYLFFIGLSIGLMAKGPVAIVLCGIIIGVWTAVSGEWFKLWKRIPWITGTILMLCICTPWFLIAEHKTPGFLEYFIVGEHWKRFTESGWTGDLYGRGHAHAKGTIWGYWLIAAFPWSLLFLKQLITALIKKNSIKLFQSEDGWLLYCLLWMTIPLLFFTFSANIIWTYALPGLPGFALLLSEWMGPFRFKAAISLLIPASFLGMVIVYNVSSPDFFKSQRLLVETFQQRSHPEDHLIYLIDRPYSAQFYLHGNALKIKGIAALEDSLHTSSKDFYAIRNDWISGLPDSIKLHLELIKRFNTFTLYHHSKNNNKR